MPAVVTPCPGKAVRKDAGFQIFAKGLAHKGIWRVVVSLAVKLARAGQLKPGLEMLGNGLVQQRAFGVAGVVELGFGCCCWLCCSKRSVACWVVRMGSAV